MNSPALDPEPSYNQYDAFMVDVNDAKVVNHSFVITTKQLASILGWSCLIQGCVC